MGPAHVQMIYFVLLDCGRVGMKGKVLGLG